MTSQREGAPNITELLRAWGDGKAEAMDELLPLVYDDLRRRAAGYLRQERPDHTLQTTALVHEAYLKLVDQREVDWKNRDHFFAIAAQAMVGKYLGAGDPRDARASSVRMIELGVVAGVVLMFVVAVIAPWFPTIFSSDHAVQDLGAQVLLVVAVLQPLAAVVFVLDGVLIGAGDQRYLALAMVVATFGVFAPVAIVISAAGSHHGPCISA